jgi:hypothetical protein
MPTDPELRRLYLDVQKASESLSLALQGMANSCRRGRGKPLSPTTLPASLSWLNVNSGAGTSEAETCEMLEDPDLRPGEKK